MSLIELEKFDKGDLRKGFAAVYEDTGWRPPAQFPEHYVHAVRLAYDVETRETDFKRGAGWSRGLGYVVGVSLAAQFSDGKIESVYLPIAHDLEREYNLDEAKVWAFLKWLLQDNTKHVPKYGANLIYDFGWLVENGVHPQGKHYDVQFAESLFTNDGVVNLEYLGQKYVGVGKDTDKMYDWIARTFPKTAKSYLRKHIWQTPTSLVGYYAEQDAVLPLLIIEKQWAIMQQNELIDAFELDCSLIPMLVYMRHAGVTVDIDKTIKLRDDLNLEIEADESALLSKYGASINVNSGDEIAFLCDRLGLHYPRSRDTNKPSFEKKWLNAQSHPLFKDIVQIREKKQTVSTFLENYFLSSAVGGKVHPNFNPTRADDGGTRTGRFSSSQPNFQNIPSRSDLGKRIRELIIPDVGHECLKVGDYSQIEYRWLAHFAVGQGADELRAEYNADPTTCYHKRTQSLVKNVVGMDIARPYIKNINFGLLYGMSIKALAELLGLTVKECVPLFDAYHIAAPYVKSTMAHIADTTGDLGYVRTAIGRKGYFDEWQPMFESSAMPLPYDQAVAKYGHMIERAMLYKAVNYKIQGSAADMMKAAMRKGWEDGVFHVTGVPRLTVHDELLWSIPEKTPQMLEALTYMDWAAENCMDIRVPVRFESDFGSTWGEAK